jgi:hypothetical protein
MQVHNVVSLHSYLLEYLTFPAEPRYPINQCLRSLEPRGIRCISIATSIIFAKILLDTAIESSGLIETLHLTPSLKNLYIEGGRPRSLTSIFFLALMPRSDYRDGLPLCSKLEL